MASGSDGSGDLAAWLRLRFATRQVLVGNRKGIRTPGEDFDIPHEASAALAITELDVIAARVDGRDRQAFIRFNRLVGIVLALVRSPFIGAGGSETKFRD